MWDLFGWPVLGTIAAVLIGVGFSLMSTTPPELEAAKWCFHVAALLLLIKTATWLIGQQSNVIIRAVAAFLLSGIVGTAWFVSVHWVRSRQEGLAQTSEAREPAAAVPPFPLFLSISKKYWKQLGEPYSLEESLAQTYQAEHEHATILWNAQTTKFYFLDPKTGEWRSYLDTVDADPKWYDDDHNRELLHTPDGFDPPYGGVAVLWDEDEENLKWIGWRKWHYQYNNGVIYQQRFDKGFVIGSFIHSPTMAEGRAFIITDDHKWWAERLSGAPAPDDTPPGNTHIRRQ